MTSELALYLQYDSPFLPEVDLGLLDSIIRDLFLEQSYHIGEAIAKGLILIGLTSAVRALSRKSGKRTATHEDLVEYIQGFTRPLRLLQIAYVEAREESRPVLSWLSIDAERDFLGQMQIALWGAVEKEPVEELGMAEIMLALLPADVERDFLLKNVALAVELLNADLSGVELMNQIVQKELPRVTNLYHKVGLEAARRTFVTYSEILNTIISHTKDEREEPEPLQRLIEYEETTPISPKPLPRKARQLEEALAKSIDNPSWSTVFFVLLRHPGILPRFLIWLARFVYSVYKNPNMAMREMSKVADMMPKMQEVVHDEWQTGELVSRLEPEFTALEERMSRVIPPTPYPSKDFVGDIQRIRELRERATSEADAGKKLLEEWKQLAQQPGLEKHSALWTAIHIAFGDFAERQLALTGEKRFIRVARRAYSIPLKKSTLWKADLGTRCICAARLGELYCKHGSALEMPPFELARAIHDAYLDALKSNERLYQRSPFRESKEKLQALVNLNLAVARITESCVYLSEQSGTESVKWRREAFMLAENGKSRILREEMVSAERVLPPEIPSALRDDEKRCLDRLRDIHATDLAEHGRDTVLGLSSRDELYKESNELRLELESIWAQMEDYGDTACAYVSVRRDEAFQWGGLQWDRFQRVAERLGERVALVSISMLPGSVFLSVLRAGWEAPKVRTVSLPRKNLLRCVHIYNMEILNRYSIDPTGLWWKLHPPTSKWQELGEVLFTPLEPLLTDIDCVYFLPHGPLHRLPLHALTVNGKPLIERWAVAYAPSVSVLEFTLSRPRGEGSVLVMGYASPDDPRKKLTELIIREASEVAKHLHILPVPPEGANAIMLEEHGPSARLIHLSCHGEFNSKEPLNSGIKLADRLFSARDWLRLRLRADLVTLSACQTGMSDIRPGDDFVGLMRAILVAGASSLLMTLWSVDALTTQDWMLKFYKGVWDEKGVQIADKASAFRNATLELQKDWPDPYYWAPFILIGNVQ